MNIKRIAIIKGFNEEKGKQEIERIVIFYDNGSVDVQEYNRIEHLRLVANFLNSNGMDILDDGLRNGMRAELISIVNREDQIAMDSLNHDILEAGILNEGNTKEEVKAEEENEEKEEVEEVATPEEEAKEEKAPVEKENHVVLDEEFVDLARYFRLSILREKGVLPKSGEKEIKEIVDRNDRALAIEEARREYLAGNIGLESYEEVYNYQRNALNEAIKASNLVEDEPVAEEENVKEEVKEEEPTEEKEEEAGLSDEFKELARYFRLAYLRDHKVLPPVGEEEIKLLENQNERVNALEEVRRQYLNNNISEEKYREFVELQRAALADAIKEANERKAKVKVLTKEEKEEPVKRELSPEYKELINYFRKNMLRNRGVLPPAGEKEIQELRERNERVAALEETREKFLAGDIKREDYEKVYTAQRNALNEAYRALLETERAAEEVAAPAQEKAEEVVEETSNEEEINNDEVINEDLYKENNINEIDKEELNKFDNNKEEFKDLYNDNLNEIKKEENVNRAIEEDKELDKIFEEAQKKEATPVVPVTPVVNPESTEEKAEEVEETSKEEDKKEEEPIVVEGTVEDAEEDEDEPSILDEKEEVKEPVSEEPKKLEDGKPGFILVGSPYEPIPSKENKVPKKEVELPSLNVNKDIIPGSRIVDYIDEDEEKEDKKTDKKEPVVTEEEVEVPSMDPVHNEETKKVKVKKRNRVWAGLIALVAGVPLVGWLVAKLAGGDAKKAADPTLTPSPAVTTPGPTEEVTPKETNEEVSPTPAATEETTVSEAVIVANSVTAYADFYNVPEETRNFLLRADVIDFLTKFKNPDQRKEVISALAFGYEMNYLCNEELNFRTSEDKDYILKSFCFDFICAKAVVNGYTPEQMATAFGNSNMTLEKLMDGFHGFYNMLTVYGINAFKTPPFRYLCNGETKDCKAFNQLFHSLAVVNMNRRQNTLTSDHTDDFIVTVDKLYGRGSGLQFSTEGAATLGMSLVNAFNYGQSNIAYGEALVLQKDYGVSHAGLTLGVDDEGRWLFDGYNYEDLFTQANKGWGSAEDYNDRCYTYRQRLSQNLEKARQIAGGEDISSRYQFADAIDDYPELAGYAESIKNNTYNKETLDAIYNIAVEKYPHLVAELNNFVEGHNDAVTNGDLVSIDEYAPEVDRFFGLGLREDYAFDEVMIYYVNKAHQEGLNVVFRDGEGNIITGKAPKGHTGGNGGGTNVPKVPAPEVVTTTTTTQVTYDELTPEEKHQVDQQVEQKQQEEDHAWQEKIDHAQEVADDVTTQLHDGTISQDDAKQQLEDAGITVDSHYFETMDQIHEDEVQAKQEADHENQVLTEQSVQAAEENNAQEAAQQEAEHNSEEELINQSLALDAAAPAESTSDDSYVPEAPAAPAQEQQEVVVENPVVENPVVEAPAPDAEIDPNYGSDEEEPYTGKNADLRNTVASLGDFGIEETGRARSLRM
jgi:hypothetical protein